MAKAQRIGGISGYLEGRKREELQDVTEQSRSFVWLLPIRPLPAGSGVSSQALLTQNSVISHLIIAWSPPGNQPQSSCNLALEGDLKALKQWSRGATCLHKRHSELVCSRSIHSAQSLPLFRFSKHETYTLPAATNSLCSAPQIHIERDRRWITINSTPLAPVPESNLLILASTGADLVSNGDLGAGLFSTAAQGCRSAVAVDGV